MKRARYTMGTVVPIAIFPIMTVVLWFNAYFIVLSREQTDERPEPRTEHHSGRRAGLDDGPRRKLDP